MQTHRRIDKHTHRQTITGPFILHQYNLPFKSSILSEVVDSLYLGWASHWFPHDLLCRHCWLVLCELFSCVVSKRRKETAWRKTDQFIIKLSLGQKYALHNKWTPKLWSVSIYGEPFCNPSLLFCWIYKYLNLSQSSLSRSLSGSLSLSLSLSGICQRSDIRAQRTFTINCISRHGTLRYVANCDTHPAQMWQGDSKSVVLP